MINRWDEKKIPRIALIFAECVCAYLRYLSAIRTDSVYYRSGIKLLEKVLIKNFVISYFILRKSLMWSL